MTEVRFVSGAIDAGDCVSRAWGLVSRRLGIYVGVGIVSILLIGCVPFVGSFLFGPVMGGFYYLVLRDMRDEEVEFGNMFKGFEKFVPLMLVGLIQSAPGLVMTVVQYSLEFARAFGSRPMGDDVNFYQARGDSLYAGLSGVILIVILVFVVIGMIWSIAVAFAIPLVMEHDLGVIDALLTSAKAAFNNLGGLILLIILEMLVMILGVIALCFGIFVAIPVVYAANVVAYRYVFPYVERGGSNMAPPPPTEYGGTYGTGYGST